MDNTTLFQKIVQHMMEYLETDLSHLTMDSRLTAAIENLSSLNRVELLLYLEDCFEVDFDESAIENVDTMRDLAGYIKSLQADTLQVT